MHSCPQDEKYARQLQDEEFVTTQKKERQQYEEYGENKNDIVREIKYIHQYAHTAQHLDNYIHVCRHYMESSKTSNKLISDMQICI